MRILALGATGAIGSHLAVILASMGHEVTITSRRERPPKQNIGYVTGNARDDDFLRALLNERWDAIIDFMVYDTKSFDRRADALLAASSQYLFVSSARVFANADAPLTEGSARLLDVSKDTAYLASDEYALTKARQEDRLRASGRRNWTIVRPYITYGEGRLQLGTFEKESWLYRALDHRSIVFCDALMARSTTMTDGHDVARMMAALIGNPANYGEDFNLVAGPPTTWESVANAYLRGIESLTGLRPVILLANLQDFSKLVPNLSQLHYDRMFDRCFDNSKIEAAAPLVDLTDCMAGLSRWLRAQISHGSFLPIDWRGEALLDRASGDRTGLCKIKDLKAKLRYLKYRYMPPMIVNRARPK